MATTPWQDPEKYVKNSPIFYVDKVKTPLLMMNNKRDGAIFFQGIEFFTALRRLQKRVWMLQYDDGDHILLKKADALQHTIRMTQFFDHYLKDAPAPKWMLEGIPAKMKGIEDGLELVEKKDSNGNWLTPQEGRLLTDEEKKKVGALKKRGPITVTIE